MHRLSPRRVALAALVCWAAIPVFAAESRPPAVSVSWPAEAQPLSVAEGEALEGRTWIKGTQIAGRQETTPFRWRPGNARLVHCDIIALNRIEEMGYTATMPNGARPRPEVESVSTIFNNLSTAVDVTDEPIPGTVGFIFSSSPKSPERFTHMQAYDARPSAAPEGHYMRYSNDSFTERAYVAPRSFRGRHSAREAFMPLRRSPTPGVWSRSR